MLQHSEHITFTIVGNDRGNHDNALPKLKMTGKQHWTPKAQKYVRYKEYVLATFFKAVKDHPEYREFMRNAALTKKPLNTTRDRKGRMEIAIQWKNHAHGDPENIFGAIADSIFGDDKYLDGSFASRLSDNKQAKVDVVIYL